MDKQEENTESIKTKRRRTESPSSLPLDVTTTILSKLPVTSVVKFRCVSKVWSSITKEQYFINSFETRPSLLLYYRHGDKLFVFTIPQHNQNPKESFSYSTSQPIDSFSFTYPKKCPWTVRTQSIQGLICLQKAKNPIIWNPSIRKFSTLSEPEPSWKSIAVILGYDRIEGKHKVVAFPCRGAAKDKETYNEFRVFTLGSDPKEPWRTIKTNHNHLIPYHRPQGIYVRGVLYCEAARMVNQHHVREIMSFDVNSEKPGLIELPPWGGPPWWERRKMISYNGKLALADSKVKKKIEIWVLEDAEKHKWSKNVIPSLYHYDVHLTQGWNLIGCTDDGEQIYVPKSFLTCFNVIYIDPKRETLRRVHYRGIVDDEFRQRNGIGDKHLSLLEDRGRQFSGDEATDKRLNYLQFSPNHIATLLAF